ncbi:MAG: DUF4123 domain-containing protein [Polyangiaceae bacterium]|nr:DUF4123 domain-containing protein [Polyangiaceae bacterium]NUQ74550.1 DUF4123 domain-containing protein [Polyangiaceae bacterium]
MGFVDRILEEIGSAPGAGGGLSLYALLDAAREPRVVSFLEGVPETSDSLYEGEKGRELAPYAPYLVEIPGDSPLAGDLAAQAFGKSYCVFVTAEAKFTDLRRHFRRYLMAETEDGKKVYFRFYDPRVLRVFLPTCTPEELRQFFGPIRSFWAEAREPETLSRFWVGEDGLLREDKRSISHWEQARSA